jgi:hypothetical protein
MGSNIKPNKFIQKGGAFMRAVQLTIAVIAALMMLGTFGMSIWVNSRFAVSSTAQCYMPIIIITTGLVLLTVILTFIKK